MGQAHAPGMESRPPTVSDDPDFHSVLAALTDEDCRAILEALESPMSAQEIAETCDIPLSTTYRKVNMLSEAALVEERIDVKRGSKHTKRYIPDFDRVNISREESGSLTIDLDRGLEDADRQISRAWGEVRQEI